MTTRHASRFMFHVPRTTHHATRLPLLCALISSLLPAPASQPGTVVSWGSEALPYVEPGTRFTRIAAGGSHSLALKADATVVAWGDNSYGQATVPGGLTNVLAIAAGDGYSLALKSDGTVVGCGYNHDGQTTPPAGLTNVLAIAAGGYHSLALKSDGTVVGWGDNSSGQTNVPVELNNVVAIAGGANHSLALKSDGTVVGWGYNIYGQTDPPSGLSNMVAIAGGVYHSLALVAPPPLPVLRLEVYRYFGSYLYAGVSVGGVPGETYVLKYTSDARNTNWADWTPLATNTVGSSNWFYLDPGSACAASRLYGARPLQ